MLAPKQSAPRPARTAERRGSPLSWSGVRAVRTTPTTTTASIAPEPAPRCSPAATAITAAIAPSVDVIGATIPTLPTRSAAYESRSPPTLPAPDSASQVQAVPSRPSGRPCATAGPSTTTRPTIITQASTEGAPISRAERDEHSVAPAQAAAAPRPPRTAITCSQDTLQRGPAPAVPGLEGARGALRGDPRRAPARPVRRRSCARRATRARGRGPLPRLLEESPHRRDHRAARAARGGTGPARADRRDALGRADQRDGEPG